MPTPSTPSTPSTPARPRIRFSDEERLDFVQQIVRYQGDCPQRNRSQFWADQAALFEQEHGKPMRNGRKFVADMTQARVAKVRAEQRESGTVQPDTELSQALDQWIQFEAGQKEVSRTSALSVEQRQREAGVMRERRLALVLPRFVR